MFHLYFQEVQNISQEEFQSKPPKHTVIIVVDYNRYAKIQEDTTSDPIPGPNHQSTDSEYKIKNLQGDLA